MKALLAFALLLGAAPASAQAQRQKFTCVAEASGGGLVAETRRQLDGRGGLRGGTTTVTLPLSGAAGSLLASWEVREGLPQVARGKYLFRLPPAPDATWQLDGSGKPVRAKDGSLEIKGEQFRDLLGRGASIQLTLAGRDGRPRDRATLDRATFDAAVDLARQADARALAKSSDLRGQCTRSDA